MDTSNDTALTNSSISSSLLKKNCREGWPADICIFANICGLTSATIWFIVLFPQLWKNFRRKSVRGLSALWAIANFTSDLVNLFFVFKLEEMPTYVKIQAVYQPTLELVMLVQFWIYGSHYTRTMKLGVTAACVVGWGALIVVQFTLNVYMQMVWIAVVLWSVQTIPQVILNMKMHSTGGQAIPSVILALVGKTTDFLSTYLLLLPIQYVIMAYFSSSICYINGLQVIWYWGQEGKLKDPPENEEEGLYTIRHDAATDSSKSGDEKSESSKDGKDSIPKEELRPQIKPGIRHVSFYIRIFCFLLLSAILIGYVVGLLWNTQSRLAVLAPGSIIVVIVTARCFLHRPCRKCDFSHRGPLAGGNQDQVDTVTFVNTSAVNEDEKR